MSDRETMDELAAHVSGDEAATSILLQVLDSNRQHSEHVSGIVQANLERERDEWKARALSAEALVARMERNVLGMLYAPTPWLEPDR